MALFVAAKFSQEEMPKIYDPGGFQDLKPQDFVVVPRSGTEDIAFVSGLEYKSIHHLKLRRDAYPRVIRRASQEEIDAWWERKTLERRAFVLGKEKAFELKLDIKISHVRVDAKENKAIYHFTSDQRVDFRALVKELSSLLRIRIELWQIGVRDEARLVDGFGACGLQTCCSTWLTEFRPITIKMAKDQDISLPPTKLSGQCGRLLCCLSYEVDQYREMSKEALPKGSTVTFDGKEMVIIDRNLIAGTYLLTDRAGGYKNVKAEQLADADAKVPEQMKKFGKSLNKRDGEEKKDEERISASAEEIPATSISTQVETLEAAADPSKSSTAIPKGPRENNERRGDRDRDRDRRRDKGRDRQQDRRPGGGPPPVAPVVPVQRAEETPEGPDEEGSPNEQAEAGAGGDQAGAGQRKRKRGRRGGRGRRGRRRWRRRRSGRAAGRRRAGIRRGSAQRAPVRGRRRGKCPTRGRPRRGTQPPGSLEEAQAALGRGMGNGEWGKAVGGE